MAHSQVTDGDGLQIQRVAANMRNKQSQQLAVKTKLVTKVTKALEPGWLLWINDLS
jgi:hypothetical protein